MWYWWFIRSVHCSIWFPSMVAYLAASFHIAYMMYPARSLHEVLLTSSCTMSLWFPGVPSVHRFPSPPHHCCHRNPQWHAYKNQEVMDLMVWELVWKYSVWLIGISLSFNFHWHIICERLLHLPLWCIFWLLPAEKCFTTRKHLSVLVEDICRHDLPWQMYKAIFFFLCPGVCCLWKHSYSLGSQYKFVSWMGTQKNLYILWN